MSAWKDPSGQAEGPVGYEIHRVMRTGAHSITTTPFYAEAYRQVRQAARERRECWVKDGTTGEQVGRVGKLDGHWIWWIEAITEG